MQFLLNHVSRAFTRAAICPGSEAKLLTLQGKESPEGKPMQHGEFILRDGFFPCLVLVKVSKSHSSAVSLEWRDFDGELQSRLGLPSKRSFYSEDMTRLKSVSFHLDSRLHSFEGNASHIKYHLENGAVKEISYHEKGVLHRDKATGPAVFHFDMHGLITYQAFYEHGKLDNGDEPAEVARTFWSATKILVRLNYFKQGLLFRKKNQPSQVTYTLDIFTGMIVTLSKTWTYQGKPHRAGDKPAHLIFHENGNLAKKVFMIYGKPHRGRGKAAVIEYNLSGKVKVAERRYLRGLLHGCPAVVDFQLRKTWCFEHGRPCGRILTFNEQGRVIFSEACNNWAHTYDDSRLDYTM